MKRNFKGLFLVVFFSFITSVLSAQYWTYSAFGSNSFEDIYLQTNPNVINAGGTYTQLYGDIEAESKDFSFYKLSFSGQVLALHLYGKPSIDEKCNFFYKNPLQSGVFLLGGVTLNETEQNVVIYEIEDSGAIINEMTFLNHDPGEEEDPTTPISVPNGDPDWNYLIVGTRTHTDNSKSISITQLNTNKENFNTVLISKPSGVTVQEGLGIENVNPLAGDYVIVGASDGNQYIRYMDIGAPGTPIDEITMNAGKLVKVIKSVEGSSTYFYANGFSGQGNLQKAFIIKFQIVNNSIDTVWTRTASPVFGYYTFSNDIYKIGSIVFIAGTMVRVADSQKKPFYMGYYEYGDNIYNSVLDIPNAQAKSICYDAFNMALYLGGTMGNHALLTRNVLGAPENIEDPKVSYANMSQGSDNISLPMNIFVNYNEQTGLLSLNFSLYNDTPCEMEIYDITGSKIKTVFSGYRIQGENSVVVSTENLSRGVYFVGIKTGNSFHTEKFSIFE